MTLPQKLEQILLELEEQDSDSKAQMLIEFAEEFEEVPSNIAIRPFEESHRVPACESEAFIWSIKDPDQKYKFYFAVENPQGISAKAMAVILELGLSGETAESIRAVPDEIAYRIFGRGLSMGKGAGLMSMIRVVKALTIK